MEERRLYVGGLSEEVLEKDLNAKFSEFGTVKGVELRCKENYGNRRYFAYVNLVSDKNAIENCLRSCNNLQWRGGTLKVQQAKESYLQTIQKDILERSHNKESTKKPPTVELPKAVQAESPKARKKQSSESSDVKGVKVPSKNQPRGRNKQSSSDDSSDSDDEPKSHLGVPAWKGFGNPTAKPRASAAVPTPAAPAKVETARVETGRNQKKIEMNQQVAAPSGCRKRLYIGGLPESALEKDIKDKFGEFGAVTSVEIKCKENYGSRRYFAYIDIVADGNAIDQCIQQCNNENWRGGQLRVQVAKESYLQKAQNELLDRKNQDADAQNRFPKPETSQEEPMDTGPAPWDRRNQHQQQEQERYQESSENQWNNRYESRQQSQRESHDERHQRPNYDRPQHSNYDRPQQSSYDRPQRSFDRGQEYQQPEERTFESERNGLFDGIDAADELGLEQDELLDEEARQEEPVDDPISEQNLKNLFESPGTEGFALSSLFADRLKVGELLVSEDEDERPSRRHRQAEELYDEDYWKRAEQRDQKSWQEMVHRHDRGGLYKPDTSSFFILPGDKRLQEGLHAFRTDNDPAQFVDCWREQAEQLTQRLLQRKRNTRVQTQMQERSSAGKLVKPAGKRKFFRKALPAARS